jgi:hypothetical protein
MLDCRVESGCIQNRHRSGPQDEGKPEAQREGEGGEEAWAAVAARAQAGVEATVAAIQVKEGLEEQVMMVGPMAAAERAQTCMMS